VTATEGTAQEQEYGRIIAEIREQLTGDLEHDHALLRRYTDRYRRHPQAEAILREIGRMLFETLPSGARAKLERAVDDVHRPFHSGLADARQRLMAGDAPGARQALERVVEQFDPGGTGFADDTVSEYRYFLSPYEAALYRRMFRPTRKVRRLPIDLVQLYLLYGATLVEVGDLDAAESALRRAHRFNPVNPPVLFELGEVLKMQRRWDEFRELSEAALAVSLDAVSAARAYRNLGFLRTEQGDFDVAAACYQKSRMLDDRSAVRCAHELAYIEQRAGRPVVSLSDPEAVDTILRANGIQVGMTEAAGAAVDEVRGRKEAREIADTVHRNLMARNIPDGTPGELAAELLSCAGQYRDHPMTPGIVRRLGWRLTDEASPDLRAKLCVAVDRLAADPDAALAFVDRLELRTTHTGRAGTAAVFCTDTGAMVTEYDFAEKSVTLNRELAEEGSDFPPVLVRDATELLLTYVGELTADERT